jgi:pyruvate dehydrogenase E2 component (dihydrolipoamide acetyltransferase)
MAIVALKMPKWGLSMAEGTIRDWWKAEGDTVTEGEDLVDVETSKITNVFQAPASGTLRRIVGRPGDVIAVGGLVAVLAEADDDDQAVSAFVDDFQARFVPEVDEEGEAGLETVRATLGDGRVIAGLAAGAGGGLPVVFLHGFGGDASGWGLVQAGVAGHAPTLALDLPGHGASSPGVGDGSPEALGAAIVEALGVLGHRRVHLVAHSLGAAVALAAQAAAPASVASLTLVCPAALPGTTLNTAYLDGFVAAGRARDLAKVMEALFTNPALATRDLAETVLKTKRLDGMAEALQAIRAQMDTPAFAALGARVSTLATPLSVITSPGDQIVGMADPSALPAGATHVSLDEVGHMPQVEKAGAVVEVVLARIG